jgi:Na+-translocating ferredoxin:NAD+ oxidoreductase subunit C
MGGAMMGFPLADDSLPVIKGTNCIVVASREEDPAARAAMPCIRCGECAEVCPAQLLPQQFYWHARSGELDRLDDYHLFDCIECGCCDVACPSQLPLTQYFRYAKTELWARDRDRPCARPRAGPLRGAQPGRGRAGGPRRRLEEKAKAAEQARGDEGARKAAMIEEALQRVQARRDKDGEDGSGRSPVRFEPTAPPHVRPATGSVTRSWARSAGAGAGDDRLGVVLRPRHSLQHGGGGRGGAGLRGRGAWPCGSVP